jgi:hypothetical protein
MKIEARVRSQESPSEIFGGRIDTKMGISPSTSAFLASIILSNALSLSTFSLLFSAPQVGEDWECQIKGMLLEGRKKERKKEGKKERKKSKYLFYIFKIFGTEMLYLKVASRRPLVLLIRTQQRQR